MPSNITGLDQFTDPIVAPNAGEVGRAADVQAVAQAAANRTTRIARRVPGVLADYEEICSLVPFLETGSYATTLDSGAIVLEQSAAGGSCYFQLPGFGAVLGLFGARVTGLRIRYVPAKTHGALPVQPSLTLWRQVSDESAAVQIATQQDAAANVGAYQQAGGRSIFLSGLTEALSNNNTLFAEFVGEAGGNFAGPLKITLLAVTIGPVP